MTRAWVIHALRSAEYEQAAFTLGLVAMGWHEVGSLEGRRGLAATLEAVRSAYPYNDADSLKACARQLHDFRSTVSGGDIVVLLRRDRPEVAMGRVTGEYSFGTDVSDGPTHTRSVDWKRLDVARISVEPKLFVASSLHMLAEVGRHDVIADLNRLMVSGNSADDSEQVETSSPDSPFGNLQRNLRHAQTLATAGAHMDALGITAFEVSDVFRAAWVQAVAALDHWVREEVRHRMLELVRRPGADKPKGFMDFPVPWSAVESAVSGHSREALALAVDSFVIQSRGHMSYQHPDKIKEAFRLIADFDDLWGRAAAVLSHRAEEYTGVTGKELRQRLLQIAARRNKIAHEYDADPGYPSGRRPIDVAESLETIRLIEAVASAILLVVDPDQPLAGDGPSGL